MTHNQYIKLFTDFAANHTMINSFGNGGKMEVTASSAIGTPTMVMWAINQPTTIAGNVQSDKYLFLFGDIVN